MLHEKPHEVRRTWLGLGSQFEHIRTRLDGCRDEQQLVEHFFSAPQQTYSQR
jgi:hypothetical protein